MKRHEIITSLALPLIEISSVIGAFFIAYYLRQITDGIPFIQLPIPYISPDQFFPFIISGAFFWWLLFMQVGLYRYEGERPLLDTIRRIITRSLLWFFLYISFVYLSTGFLFSKEIPRLIIAYVWLLSTIFSILIHISIYTLMGILYRHNFIEKNKILILIKNGSSRYHPADRISSLYIYKDISEKDTIEKMIRSGNIDMIFSLADMEEKQTEEIIKLCSIYGIRFSYPKIPKYVYDISRYDTFIGNIPVIESSALAMSAWDRITKRTIDILFSSIALIILSPLFFLIMLAIKIEDGKGPVIYKNRRIGISGKEFFLYKFRYMYWKYSVKDAYGVSKESDEALKYEEELKKVSDSRKGPLYKIKNDPRKTHIGSIIEKLSLDELPQLWNVLKGEMSIIGPRPHQPREVDLYEENHYQLLTVKPGITGMAQVSGREKNTFEEEVAYDVYYIEHYSLLLDILILTKTIGVVVLRAFR